MRFFVQVYYTLLYDKRPRATTRDHDQRPRATTRDHGPRPEITTRDHGPGIRDAAKHSPAFKSIHRLQKRGLEKIHSPRRNPAHSPTRPCSQGVSCLSVVFQLHRRLTYCIITSCPNLLSQVPFPMLQRLVSGGEIECVSFIERAT